jgi:hypothetical protein
LPSPPQRGRVAVDAGDIERGDEAFVENTLGGLAVLVVGVVALGAGTPRLSGSVVVDVGVRF